jgi:hypothetical protein
MPVLTRPGVGEAGGAVAGECCGTSRWGRASERNPFAMHARSLDRLSEQFGQADKVVGRHRESELPIDLQQSAMPHFAQARHRLGPAKGFLDPFADALRDRIAGMTGGAFVDRRAAAVGVLSYPLSAPSVTGCEVSVWGWISVSAAHRSAWPVAVVVTAPTIRALRFSISAWPMKHSRASLPKPLRNRRASGSVVEPCVIARTSSDRQCWLGEGWKLSACN